MIATSRTLDPGQSFNLKAMPKADAEADAAINGGLGWSSSNPNVAIVIAGADQFNVIVKGVNPGTANIIASAQAIPFGPNVNSTFTVTVSDAVALPLFTHFTFDAGPVF